MLCRQAARAHAPNRSEVERAQLTLIRASVARGARSANRPVSSAASTDSSECLARAQGDDFGSQMATCVRGGLPAYLNELSSWISEGNGAGLTINARSNAASTLRWVLRELVFQFGEGEHETQSANRKIFAKLDVEAKGAHTRASVSPGRERARVGETQNTPYQRARRQQQRGERSHAERTRNPYSVRLTSLGDFTVVPCALA